MASRSTLTLSQLSDAPTRALRTTAPPASDQQSSHIERSMADSRTLVNTFNSSSSDSSNSAARPPAYDAVSNSQSGRGVPPATLQGSAQATASFPLAASMLTTSKQCVDAAVAAVPAHEDASTQTQDVDPVSTVTTPHAHTKPITPYSVAPPPLRSSNTRSNADVPAPTAVLPVSPPQDVPQLRTPEQLARAASPTPARRHAVLPHRTAVAPVAAQPAHHHRLHVSLDKTAPASLPTHRTIIPAAQTQMVPQPPQPPQLAHALPSRTLPMIVAPALTATAAACTFVTAASSVSAEVRASRGRRTSTLDVPDTSVVTARRPSPQHEHRRHSHALQHTPSPSGHTVVDDHIRAFARHRERFEKKVEMQRAQRRHHHTARPLQASATAIARTSSSATHGKGAVRAQNARLAVVDAGVHTAVDALLSRLGDAIAARVAAPN
ncbi:MAG: hypothetical protein EOO41_01990 [Methanobacteriota archaeon]|nr:MAG: hypothetical protein EOO41_01990 [Euryarchaeota archaeon]